MIFREIGFFILFLTCVLSEDKEETKEVVKEETTEVIKNENREESHTEEIKKPNIVFIVADDMGWGDVSFHGSNQILTPNIDVLAYSGVILQQYYTDTLGTPSTSAMLTGKYPLRLGTQSASITATEDRGLPINERLLPSYLKDLGYSTHLIGKWNVGRSREHYLPTYRGFDSFYGFHGGSVDYFTYNLVENVNDTSFFGLDMFNNTTPMFDLKGHLTEVLTDRAVELIREHNTSIPLYLHVSHAAPHIGGGLVNLQPPAESIAENDHIAHTARRYYAGLVTSLDKSVGHIVAALAEKRMLQHTLIVFVSDNGAPSKGTHKNYGSNLPLRGSKNSPWDGASRSIALAWFPTMTPRINRELFHVTDWLPTIVAAAGGNLTTQIDGINQWETLTKDEKSKRRDMLITIDDQNGWAAFRDGDFKMIVGELDEANSGYYGMELKALRKPPPNYEAKLLESETFRVFKETLSLLVDVDEAIVKRNASNLLTHVNSENEIKTCIPTKVKGCLYNITDDPLEAHDIWNMSPEIVRHMTLRLRGLWAELKPRCKPKPDLKADPSLKDYVWHPWIDNLEESKQEDVPIPSFPLQVSMAELKYLIDLNLKTYKDKIFQTIQNMGDSFVKSVGGLFSF